MNLLVINKTLHFFWHYRLPISIALFSILFVTIRLPFWTDVNVFYLFDDAGTYARIAQDIVSGNAPLFNVRTPGYPLYLAFFLKAFGNNLGVVFAANVLITLFVSLAFIYVFYRIYPSYTYSAAITAGLFTSSISFLNSETAYLTEHLYMSMLLGFVAWLILAVKRTSALYLIALSLWFSLVVYVRPSGLFLLPLLAVLSLWIRYRKYPAKFQLALWLPLVLAYLLLSSYNKATLNMFTLTPFGEINLAYATTTFAQPDPELPDYVNRAILVSTRQITEADRRYLIDGKDVQRLTAIYLKYYNNHALLSNLQKYGNYSAPDDYINLHADVKRVAYSAIKQDKSAYAKFVYTNFVHYFRNFSPENRVSYPYLNKDFKYWEQNRLVGFFYSEPNRQGRFDGYRVNQISPTEASRRLHAIEAGGLHDAANALTKLRNDLFGSLFWVYLYIVAYLIILIVLIKSRFNDTNAFLFFLIGSIPLLSGILVSLVEISVIRYSITTEFVYYLLAFTLPLWLPEKRIGQLRFQRFHTRQAASQP